MGSDRRPGPERLAALLEEHGSDGAVARALGVSPTAVRNWRLASGVPAQVVPHQDRRADGPETTQLRSLIAEHGTDRAVGDLLGVSAETVRGWRRRDGIAAGDADEQRPDADLLLALLKEHGSDGAVAEVLAVAESTVRRWRKHHGIPAAGKPGRRRSHEPPPADHLRSLLVEHGTDRGVAMALGVSASTVAQWRRSSGIPAASETERPAPEVLEELFALHRTAGAVAAVLGVSASTVRRWRRDRRQGRPDT